MAELRTGGFLYIEGTNQADTINVRESNGAITIDNCKIKVNGALKSSVSSASVKVVDLYALGGNDKINLNTSSTQVVTKMAYLYAGDGDDTVQGGKNIDKIYGGSGNDFLYGNLGNDEIWGDGGNDWLDAGSASEKVYGGTGTNWNAYAWAVNGTKATDVDQGSAGTCVILSAMAAAADKGVDLSKLVTYVGNHKYEINLYDARYSRWTKWEVLFDGKTNGYDPSSVETNSTTNCKESWTILFQRAYANFTQNLQPHEMGSYPGEYNGNRALAALTGWKTESTSVDDWSATKIRDTLAAGHLITAMGIVEGSTEGHAYAVSKVFKGSDGKWRVTLYNPWGYDATHDGIPHETDSNNDGYINILFSDFQANFPVLSVAKKP